MKIILGQRYEHRATGRVYTLYLADLYDDDDDCNWIELYKGDIKELHDNRFREIWAGSLMWFKAGWKLFTEEDEKKLKDRLEKERQARVAFECRD